MNLVEKAKQFAIKAHEGQTRKRSGTPMISHPIRVAKTLEDAGFPDYVVAAGYLHDTVEDTDTTMEDIICEFGERTAWVVAGNTENKEHSWEDRKLKTVTSIITAPLPIKALIVADKLDNFRSLAADYEEIGEEIWSYFNRGKDQQKWYFTTIACNMNSCLPKDEIPTFFHDYSQILRDFKGW